MDKYSKFPKNISNCGFCYLHLFIKKLRFKDSLKTGRVWNKSQRGFALYFFQYTRWSWKLYLHTMYTFRSFKKNAVEIRLLNQNDDINFKSNILIWISVQRSCPNRYFEQEVAMFWNWASPTSVMIVYLDWWRNHLLY